MAALRGSDGHPEWADNELFANAQIRSQYWDALKPLMLEWTMQYTVEDIYRRSQEKGIPLGAVRNAEQVLEDKQMKAREFFVDVERKGEGKLTFPGVPYRFSGIQRERRPPHRCWGKTMKKYTADGWATANAT